MFTWSLFIFYIYRYISIFLYLFLNLLMFGDRYKYKLILFYSFTPTQYFFLACPSKFSLSELYKSLNYVKDSYLVSLNLPNKNSHCFSLRTGSYFKAMCLYETSIWGKGWSLRLHYIFSALLEDSNFPSVYIVCHRIFLLCDIPAETSAVL